MLRIDVDNSLFLLELHLGGYVRGRLSDRITTYAAAGPMVMYGEHKVKDENVEQMPAGTVVNGTVVIENSDSNDVNIGYYGRAGIDFEVGEKQHMGVGRGKATFTGKQVEWLKGTLAKHSGADHVVVMGHTRCGAIQALLDQEAAAEVDQHHGAEEAHKSDRQ